MSTWISQGVLKGATGPAGGVFGSVIVDFGSSDNGGADAMSVTVTVSASWVTSTSYPIVGLAPGGDHLDADDITSEEVYALVTNVVIGVSFDIEVFAPNGTWGQWLVNWGAALTGSTPPGHAPSHGSLGSDAVTLAESQITNLVTDLAAKAPTSRIITAGDGLAGGGDLSANRSFAVDGTVGRIGGTSHYYDYDDFMGPPKLLTPGTSGNINAVIASSTVDFGNGHHGVFQLAPGNAASQWARLIGSGLYLEASTITLRAWISTNLLGSDTVQWCFGLTDNPGPTVTTSNYYLMWELFPSNNANWAVQHRSLTNSSGSNSSTAGVSGTWYDLKIIASASSVSYYMNGTLYATVTTNIPPSTQLLYPSVFINNQSGTANRSLYIDTYEIDIDTGIAGKFFKSAI